MLSFGGRVKESKRGCFPTEACSQCHPSRVIILVTNWSEVGKGLLTILLQEVETLTKSPFFQDVDTIFKRTLRKKRARVRIETPPATPSSLPAWAGIQLRRDSTCAFNDRTKLTRSWDWWEARWYCDW